jgi:peptidyl-prolyl cis-trans isomerase SurA
LRRADPDGEHAPTMKRALLAWLCLVPAVQAQVPGDEGAPIPGDESLVDGVLAVVNDDIVTEFDLAIRIQLVIRSSGLPDSQEARSRLAPQLLRQLIDERLQMQEAERRGVEVTEDEFARALGQLESDNGIPEGQLQAALEQFGIPYQGLVDRVRVDLTWQKLQVQRLRPTIEITNDEVEEVLSRILANQGSSEFRVAEIYLGVDSPDQEQEVRESADRLLEELARGASFSALARQFSQRTISRWSATAPTISQACRKSARRPRPSG